MADNENNERLEKVIKETNKEEKKHKNKRIASNKNAETA